MTRSVTAIAALIGLAATAFAAAPAAAEEGMFFKDVLGTMGIIPKSKEAINYRDRAPLVVPPKPELRSPGTRSSAAANPAWPKDPDIAARRRAAAEAAQPVTWSDRRRSSDEINLRLTPAEIQAGRVAGHAASTPESHRGDSARDVLYMTPDQLRARSRTADAGGDQDAGARRSLTDPPSGMRKPVSGRVVRADSAPMVDQQRLDANPMTWLTRGFKNEDDD